MDGQSCSVTNAGRVTSRITGDFVILILGAHMNSLTAFFAYKKIGYLMKGMLRELVVRAQPANQETMLLCWSMAGSAYVCSRAQAQA